jgi:hypothetical protein
LACIRTKEPVQISVNKQLVYCAKEKTDPIPADALKRRIIRTMVSKILGLGMLVSSDSVHYQLKRIAGEELVWHSSVPFIHECWVGQQERKGVVNLDMVWK